MLILQNILDNTEEIKTSLVNRGFKKIHLIDIVLDKWKSHNKTKLDQDTLIATQRKVSESFKNETDPLLKAELLNKAKDLKNEIALYYPIINDLEKEINDILLTIPNIVLKDVPLGNSADDNQIIFSKPFELLPNAIPHWEICESKKIINWEKGNSLTETGFPVYINEGARLQRALINFFLDKAFEKGYIEHQVPELVSEDSVMRTGQFPDKAKSMFKTTEGLYLIPTAEVSLTNLYKDQIIKEKEFPIKMTAHSRCFRTEKGSWGSNVRGLNRLKEFDKVELVVITIPEQADHLLEEMNNHVQELLELLELPYRKLLLCSKDTGFTSAKTYDWEVWSMGQNKWLEVSSVSNFLTYQTNRLKCRYKDAFGNYQKPFTLNGSALALPRIMAALLENGWDGEKVNLPKCLLPYYKKDFI